MASICVFIPFAWINVKEWKNTEWKRLPGPCSADQEENLAIILLIIFFGLFLRDSWDLIELLQTFAGPRHPLPPGLNNIATR